jgi:hypothetical protein
MTNESKQDPPVGYRNPPRATRFKPGQSGNPSGRPKRVPSLRAELRDELSEMMHVREGGGDVVELTKGRAIIKALVQAAVGGNLRAANTLLTFCDKSLGDTEEPHGDDIAPEGSPIVEAYRRREARLHSDAGEADAESSTQQSIVSTDP